MMSRIDANKRSASPYTTGGSVKKRKCREQQLEDAKSRLSGFARRIFDPHRVRGLVEPPQVIPLNDEFLKDFGKREKEAGLQVEVDNRLGDDQDEADDVSVRLDTSEPAPGAEPTKVKISNIKYTTSAEAIQLKCFQYGPIVDFQLLMDEQNPELNAGRAYVTFEDAASAQACITKFTSMDGRPLTVTLASAKTPGASAPLRYWEQDIATKCFRCGQVGHFASSCRNEPVVKPCPLCAKPGHDVKDCPVKVVCFNCGIPGHVSRDCNHRRGLPVRRICVLCFQSGHDKYHCRQRGLNESSPHVRQAVCMTCGQEGHFLCQPMKFFYELKGVSCWNCGQKGHVGPQCTRPNGEVCSRDLDVARQEWERAKVGGDDNKNDRGRSRHRFEQDRRRVQSLPPKR